MSAVVPPVDAHAGLPGAGAGHQVGIGISDALDDVTVVTVTFNSRALVPQLAEVLRAFPNVIAVDNCSQDDTATLLAASLPHARVVRQERNIGFGAGNNRGVELARTPFVLFMNPDCVIEPDAVRALVECARTFPKALAVAPRVVDPQGRKYSQFKWDFRFPPPKGEPPDTEGPVSAPALEGACLMVRVEHFRTIGMYDERLFMYYEEDDLGIRATRAGYDMISTPTARAVHIGNASSPNTLKIRFIKNYHPTRSKLIMLQKHVSPLASMLLRCRIIIAAPFAITVGLVSLSRERSVRWVARLCAALSTR